MARDRAAEMREARELFQLAMRLGIPMEKAKAIRAAERHKVATERLAARRCGTISAPLGKDEDRPVPFYQQGQYA
jgi:hypothetical protein